MDLFGNTVYKILATPFLPALPRNPFPEYSGDHYISSSSYFFFYVLLTLFLFYKVVYSDEPILILTTEACVLIWASISNLDIGKYIIY